ncbi:MAG: hypothetical protein KME43_01430 [Myxacorys chilensis ATA2-1-KO14]|jgi:hypothetical protein|nr:hypothetical protein [Myxacorys chilensis ATA2-1-KO14]
MVASGHSLAKSQLAIWLSYAILLESCLASIALSFSLKRNLQILIGQLTTLENAFLRYRARKCTIPRHFYLRVVLVEVFSVGG